ncbi:MAG TPA: hypothetical protein VF412_18610 [Bdellovibrio sp.]|uniref:hypothetical protein n=1 Tax=Bdellovibrio sp. TaxID=28201 RepID=UPI002EE1C7DB
MKFQSDARTVTIKTSGGIFEGINNDVFVGDGSWMIVSDPILDPNSPPPQTILGLNTNRVLAALHVGQFVFVWSKAVQEWCYWGYGPKERRRVFNQWGITPFFDIDEILLLIKRQPPDEIMKRVFQVKHALPAKMTNIIHLEQKQP